jgi:hypothetical protein
VGKGESSWGGPSYPFSFLSSSEEKEEMEKI